jgi:diguanylate cyclase (GGDEF)-like protein
MQNTTSRFSALATPVSPFAVAAWNLQYGAPSRSLKLASEALAQAAGSGDTLSLAWSSLLVGLHDVRDGRFAQAEQAIALAADEFDAIDNGRGRRLVAIARAYLILNKGDAPGAGQVLNACLEASGGASDWGLLDQYLWRHTMAMTESRLGNVERVLHHHYRNVGMLEDLNEPAPLAVTLHNLSAALASVNAWEEAYDQAVSAHTIAMTLENPVLQRRSEINVALCARFLGRMDEAREIIERIAARSLSEPVSDFALAINAAELYAQLGQYAKAAAYLGAAREVAQRTQDRYQLTNVDWVGGLIAARENRTLEAVRLLEQGVARRHELKRMHIEILPRMVGELAMCYAAMGDYKRAFSTHRLYHELHDAHQGYSNKARILALRTRHSIEQGQRLREREETLANRFATEQLSLAAANLTLQQRLEQVESLSEQLRAAADRDALTGLGNRGYLDRALASIFTPDRRAGQIAAAVALIDVDHFKSVNDTFGHGVGDKVLQALGALLRDGIRAADVAARYGGEEFCVLLKGADAAQAKAKMEELLARFRAIQIAEITDRVLSFSCGVACSPGDGQDVEGLMKCADQRLYVAKRSGRSQVVAG